MSVAESTIICYWFKGKWLNLALAMDSCFGRIGSILIALTAPPFYNSHGLGFVSLMAFFVCCYAILCTFALVSIDKYAEKLYP